MSPIHPCELPSSAFLLRYSHSGGYVDCYVADILGSVTLAEFVEAFYTTAVFRLERSILRLAASRASTDAQARQLAQGALDTFAAWSVEERASNQLLLGDFTGRTKSWLMVSAGERDATPSTRLYFGSAVIPARHPTTGETRLGFPFSALLGFHKRYSQILLSAARSKLSRSTSPARQS